MGGPNNASDWALARRLRPGAAIQGTYTSFGGTWIEWKDGLKVTWPLGEAPRVLAPEDFDD